MKSRHTFRTCSYILRINAQESAGRRQQLGVECLPYPVLSSDRISLQPEHRQAFAKPWSTRLFHAEHNEVNPEVEIKRRAQASIVFQWGESCEELPWDASRRHCAVDQWILWPMVKVPCQFHGSMQTLRTRSHIDRHLFDQTLLYLVQSLSSSSFV